MSVINQMLKDLDSRAEDDVNGKNADFVPPEKKSVLPKLTKKQWLLFSGAASAIAVVATILLFVVPIFLAEPDHAIVNKPDTKAVDPATKTLSEQSPPQEKTASEQKHDGSQITKKVAEKEQSLITQSEFLDDAIAPALPKEPIDIESQQVKSDSAMVAAKADESATVETIAANQSSSQQQQSSSNTAKQSEKSSLAIKKVNVNAKELAEESYQQGLQSLQIGEQQQAEDNFRKTLTLMPKHVEARKRLAALWYGQNKNRDAVNLLRQGIAVVPDETEFRLLAARIYHQLGDFNIAYEYVSGLNPDVFKNIEFYAMRAALAQKLNKHLQAKEVYQKLVAVESFQGKWWLGLAISFDALKESRLALVAFETALDKDNLSQASQQYAEQRVSALRRVSS